MTDHSGIDDGPLRVTTDGEVSGIVGGDVTIARGCRVTISGIVQGDVTAGPGTIVKLTGIVNGAIHGDDATIHATGIVAGIVTGR